MSIVVLSNPGHSVILSPLGMLEMGTQLLGSDVAWGQWVWEKQNAFRMGLQ